MGAFPEAQYAIDEILEGITLGQVTGIPPQNMKSFTVTSKNNGAMIKWQLPDDTVIDGQTICTAKGVKILRKAVTPPASIDDGDVIGDYLGDGQYEDTGLTNGVTYYYAAFPHSDHGVYNFNPVNVKKVVPSDVKFWAFDQNFADKNPATTITYPAGYENEGYAPMLTNEGTGAATAGDWADFLENVLQNKPAMVKPTGELDYWLDPNDYTKKADGTASDYNNTSYVGGAFAWIKKIYVKEEYASDGSSRRVIFADKTQDGFVPLGFVDFNDRELEGGWIPMGYMDANGKTLIAGTQPCAGKTNNQERALITAFSSRAVNFGGPILHLLRDLEYMLFKSTDIQLQAGHGKCNAGSQAVAQNAVVANGPVVGWKGTNAKNQMNKYFHSQVLGSYQVWLRDPYTLVVNGLFKVSPHYKYDASGNTYTAIDLQTPTSSGGPNYPSKLIKHVDDYGSEVVMDNTGTTSTGMCDGYWWSASETMMARRLGAAGHDLAVGPAALIVIDAASYATWDAGAAIYLLPEPEYEP